MDAVGLSMLLRHLSKLLAAQTLQHPSSRISRAPRDFLPLVVAETLEQRPRRDAMVSLYGDYLFIVDC
jgi:hypothetical protein